MTTKKTKTESSDKPQWPGYTLDELQALIRANKVRTTYTGRRLKATSRQMTKGNFWLRKETFSAAVKALTYVDFIVLGVKAYRKLAPLFKKS